MKIVQTNGPDHSSGWKANSYCSWTIPKSEKITVYPSFLNILIRLFIYPALRSVVAPLKHPPSHPF